MPIALRFNRFFLIAYYVVCHIDTLDKYILTVGSSQAYSFQILKDTFEDSFTLVRLTQPLMHVIRCAS